MLVAAPANDNPSLLISIVSDDDNDTDMTLMMTMMICARSARCVAAW